MMKLGAFSFRWTQRGTPRQRSSLFKSNYKIPITILIPKSEKRVLESIRIAMTPSSRSTDTAEKRDPSAVATAEPLIPGLPDEVAELCLLHLPFPYQTLARSVSSPWNRALSSPSFLKSKSSLSLPYLFVFAFHRLTLQIQWQGLDPRSRRWFLLPPMPIPFAGAAPICPPAFSCAALASRGEIYVLGGMRSDTQAPLSAFISYRAATNSWSVASPPMPTPRSFFAAAAINGRILAAGGEDPTVESYDPEAGQWAPAAAMRSGIARYDAAVLEGRMLVTEGWTWPFNASPRGGVYDAERDTWEEMREGMREGWTGVSAVVGGRLFVVSEYGEGRVKVYDERRDTWQKVDGGGVPEAVRRPYAVSGGGEGRIYVVGSGLDVGVGTVEMEEGKGWTVDWEVVKGPSGFAEFSPCHSTVLYL